MRWEMRPQARGRPSLRGANWRLGGKELYALGDRSRARGRLLWRRQLRAAGWVKLYALGDEVSSQRSTPRSEVPTESGWVAKKLYALGDESRARGRLLVAFLRHQARHELLVARTHPSAMRNIAASISEEAPSRSQSGWVAKKLNARETRPRDRSRRHVAALSHQAEPGLRAVRRAAAGRS